MLETPRDILNVYEKRPRALTREYVASIPWADIRKTPLSPHFFRVLSYMRDIERFTEVFFEELRRTPTGKEPAIQCFMERWNAEEAHHGELLNRFLEEAGHPPDPHWFAHAKAAIPRRYRMEMRLGTAFTNLFGKYFSSAHMVWGTINELTALQAYRRLIDLAKHPVLTQLLWGIMQEESIHVHFYFNVARLQLKKSKFARGLARYTIRKFWAPVGTGIKPASDTEMLFRTIFGNDLGWKALETHVSGRIQQLPGFAGVRAVTQKIKRAFRLEGESFLAESP